MTDGKAGKVLFAATVDAHITAFHLPYLKWFRDNGYETYVAANGDAQIPYCDRKIRIDMRRNPFRPENLRARRQLAALLRQHHFALIHCHTPVGGALTRLAARKYRRSGTIVLYTAHGFHFMKGGSASGRLLYYPIEKFLSRFTDGLIAVNAEDYETARDRLRAKRTFLSRGVGYDGARFFPPGRGDKIRYRKVCGYAGDEVLLICVAELNRNKNQRFLMDALKRVRQDREAFVARERARNTSAGAGDSRLPDVRLLLVGGDGMKGAYQTYARKIGVAAQVDFLGRRDDVDKLLPMCDIAVCSSLREGLPVNVMEAMACGLPVVATDIRGHRDLIEDGRTGFLAPVGDVGAFASKIRPLIEDPSGRSRAGNAAALAIRPYAIDKALDAMIGIYKSFL
ncbi:MAG: glycosyltransferase family 4 protein [Clostridiales Family XIII bacterium]|jgi:glycosyltransferase EpsD|nr:glycosyltransferase family 4 protein [Clostridiales Family XIII bacterium]